MLRVEDHDELRWLAELAVRRGWWAGHRADPSSNPDEVDQTFRLMHRSTRYLAELWKPVFHHRRVPLRMSGVFCHKTPLATFDDRDGAKATCELGDLLIVHDRFGRDPRRRAALLQAKRTLRGTAKATDATQNDLYRRLPPFALSRKGYKRTNLKPGLRDIGQAIDFARFALVADDASSDCWLDDDRFPFLWHRGVRRSRPAWTVAHPAQDPVTSAGAEPFGSFLASMLYDTHPARGQTVAPIPDLAAAWLGSGQDLDITVQELLDLTAKRIAKSKREWGGLPRGVVAFQDGSIPMSNPGNPLPALPPLPGPGEAPPEDGTVFDDDDGEGISILFIETFGD